MLLLKKEQINWFKATRDYIKSREAGDKSSSSSSSDEYNDEAIYKHEKRV